MGRLGAEGREPDRHPGDVERAVGQPLEQVRVGRQCSGMLAGRRVLGQTGLREDVQRHAVEARQVRSPGRGPARLADRLGPLDRLRAVGVGYEHGLRRGADLLALDDDPLFDLLEPSRRLAALDDRHEFLHLAILVLPDRLLLGDTFGRNLLDLHDPRDQRLGRRKGELVRIAGSEDPGHECRSAVGDRLADRRGENGGRNLVARGRAGWRRGQRCRRTEAVGDEQRGGEREKGRGLRSRKQVHGSEPPGSPDHKDIRAVLESGAGG